LNHWGLPTEAIQRSWCWVKNSIQWVHPLETKQSIEGVWATCAWCWKSEEKVDRESLSNCFNEMILQTQWSWTSTYHSFP
jgi:hypothetical protein